MRERCIVITKHRGALLWWMRNYGHKIVLLPEHDTSLLVLRGETPGEERRNDVNRSPILDIPLHVITL